MRHNPNRQTTVAPKLGVRVSLPTTPGTLVPKNKAPIAVAKLSYEDFIAKAIVALRGDKYGKGLHTVYSGFNSAFKAYFGEDPIPVVNRLVEEGKFFGHLTKGGYKIYLLADQPTKEQLAAKSAEKALAAILG